MISISTNTVHVRHLHIHIRISSVVEDLTSPSGSVIALANDHPVNFTRQRKSHFAKSTSGLFNALARKILVNLSTELQQQTGCTKRFILILSQFGPWSVQY